MPRRTDISSTLIIGAGPIVLGASLCATACGTSTAPGAPAGNVAQAPSANKREAAFAAIAERCGLPRTALQLDGDAVAVQPPPDARYEAVDCMLRELAAGGFTKNMAIGFVGNEIPKGNDVQRR